MEMDLLLSQALDLAEDSLAINTILCKFTISSYKMLIVSDCSIEIQNYWFCFLNGTL